MKRIEARRQLWNPYLEVLAGTRTSRPSGARCSRRRVRQGTRTPRAAPAAAVDLRPALAELRTREPADAPTPDAGAARERS